MYMKHPVLPRPKLSTLAYHYLYWTNPNLEVCYPCSLHSCVTKMPNYLNFKLTCGCNYPTIEISPAKPFNLTINLYLKRYFVIIMISCANLTESNFKPFLVSRDWK